MSVFKWGKKPKKNHKIAIFEKMLQNYVKGLK